MARAFLTPIDLKGNELRNARVQNLANAPSDPVPGQLYYNSGSNEFFWFDGTEWVSAKAAGPAGGDLTGSFPNPQIRRQVIKNQHVANDAAIDVGKIAGVEERILDHSVSDFRSPTGDYSWGGHKLTDLYDGEDVADAATYGQLTNAIQETNQSIGYTADGLRSEWADADNVVRQEFADADDVVRAEFAAADASVRADFAAADQAMSAAIQAQFQASADAAAADHASIRADFATADNAVRAEFAAEDTAIRAEFAAADADVTTAVTAAYTAADTTLRTDFNAADAQIRIDFAAADTALDASLRTYADNLNAATLSSAQTQIDDVRADFQTADAALNTDLRAYIDSKTGMVSGDTENEFAAVRAEFAAADASIRTDFAAADTALGTAVRSEFHAADAQIQSNLDDVEGELQGAISVVSDALDAEVTRATVEEADIRSDFAAADTQLRTDYQAADSALDSSLRTLISSGETSIRAEIAAGDAAARTFATNRANHTGTQTVSTISDFDSAVRAVPLDEMTPPQDDLTIEGFRLTNVGAPVDPMDAANKAYVDAMNQGLDIKASVRAASTVNVVRNGPQTVDGVELGDRDRVLLTKQTDPTQNGIYTVSGTGAWQRATDANSGDNVTSGLFTFVEEGETYADSGWVLVTDGDIIPGTTALQFSQFSGAGQVEAGQGLTKDGNTLNVGGTDGRIQVNGDSVDIDADYVGQASITTVGTLTEGALGAGFTTVALAQGGTGGTSPLEARQNIGATTKASFTLNANAAQFNLVHGFNTRDVLVQVRENASPFAVVDADIEMTDLNGITVRFGSPVEANAYRVTIVG